MEAFQTIGEAIDGIVQFDRQKFEAMPEHVQVELSRLAGLGISPVDRIVRTGEMLFANRDTLTRNVDRVLTGRLIEFAGLNGWHGLNTDDRAARIKATMFGEAGEATAIPIAEADIPEPLSEFLPPSPPPADPA